MKRVGLSEAEGMEGRGRRLYQKALPNTSCPSERRESQGGSGRSSCMAFAILSQPCRRDGARVLEHEVNGAPA